MQSLSFSRILRDRVILLLPLCLLLMPVAGLGAAGDRIERGGYLLLSLEPDMGASRLQGTSHIEDIRHLFSQESERLGTALAESLEEEAIAGRLFVLAGLEENSTASFRTTGEPDTFLITVDMVSRPGFTDRSWLAAFLSTASCFTLSSWNLFRFETRTEARVRVYYFTPEGKRKGLLERSYGAASVRKGDFYDANNMLTEAAWFRRLTRKNLDELRRQIVADLPAELRDRAWRHLAEYLRRPPVGGRRRIAAPPFPELTRTPAPTPPAAEKADQPPPQGPGNLQDLVRLVSPSVFKVRTDKATGSGFVLSPRGYGVTSLHVVDGAAAISIVFHSGSELSARVARTDPELDLALLHIDSEGLSPLSLGDSDRLSVGDQLVAVGYPRDLGLTVVPGTVISLEPFRGIPLIRLDASLANGNSGGPLVDASGSAVGINFRKIDTGTEKATFGLPINIARRAFADLLAPPPSN